MKLLNTTASNTKIKKTQNKPNNYFAKPIRMASLSMLPDRIICAGSKAAGCMDACLKESGRARYNRDINIARQKKTDYWHADQAGFLAQLTRELTNFQKNVCERQNVQGVVRLNVLSDIPFEEHDIPQQFPDLFFYDYTKRAVRLGETPDNYRLMFSYSDRPEYQNQVAAALPTGVPIAVVFKNTMPTEYLGRSVIDGDLSDLDNVMAGAVVIGLTAKGPALHDHSGFVVDGNMIVRVAA
jgi:hypothetical protein